MFTRLAVLSLVVIAVAAGCGFGTSADDARNDSAIPATANLGTPPSPSADLLREMSKGNPAVNLTDSKQNERNARALPQVMANSNDAIRRIENGEDSGKVVADMQRRTDELTKR